MRDDAVTTDSVPFTLREGRPSDAAVLLDLFDRTITWMVAQGLTDQWGSEPFSSSPSKVATCERWAASGGLTVAERDGVAAAAIVLGEAMPYVAPTDVPELYVQVLIGSRRADARGAGAMLLAHAEAVARRQGVDRLRVDCFAGNDGRLVDYYVRCGFTPAEPFTVDKADGRRWHGQVLVKPLHDGAVPRSDDLDGGVRTDRSAGRPSG